MTNRSRLSRRNTGAFYAHDSKTDKQESLRTKDKATAQQLLNAENAASQQPRLDLKPHYPTSNDGKSIAGSIP